MSRISLRTRRWLVRATFLLLAIAPLFAACVWIIARDVRFRSIAVCHEITQLTGWQCEMTGLQFPRPGVVHVSASRMTDAETDQLLVETAGIERADGPGGTRYHFADLRIEESRWHRLMRDLHERLLRQPQIMTKPVLVVIDSLHVDSAVGSRTLPRVRLTFDHRSQEIGMAQLLQSQFDERDKGHGSSVVPATFADGIAADPDARSGSQENAMHHEPLAESPAAAVTPGDTQRDIDLTVRRQMDQGEATTQLLLDTQAPLPCSWLWPDTNAPLLGGPLSSFTGILDLEWSRTTVSGELSGTIDNVDMASLTADLPHNIQGMATVTLRCARFSGRRLESIEMTIQSQRLEVDSGWLNAWENQLGLRFTPNSRAKTENSLATPPSEISVIAETANQSITLEDVAVNVRIDAGGVEIAMCGISAEDDGQGAEQPGPQTQVSTIRLLQALAGASVDPFEYPVCVALWNWLPRPAVNALSP